MKMAIFTVIDNTPMSRHSHLMWLRGVFNLLNGYIGIFDEIFRRERTNSLPLDGFQKETER